MNGLIMLAGCLSLIGNIGRGHEGFHEGLQEQVPIETLLPEAPASRLSACAVIDGGRESGQVILDL